MRPQPRFPDLAFSARKRLLEEMSPNSGMLLFGASHVLRNGDAEYRFRQTSDVLYLTGWEDPDVVVWLCPGSEQPFQLFVQPRNPDVEVWSGLRAGLEGAREDFRAYCEHHFSDLEERLPALLLGVDCLYYDVGSNSKHDAWVNQAIRTASRMARKTLEVTPDSFQFPGTLLHELRLRKSDAEVEVLREAVRITAEAHKAAMQITRPGVKEYELEAIIDYRFRALGGNGAGYTTIVGTGNNACILHYVAAKGELKAGELVLVDAGCEYGWYTADVTRTWPVSGRFEGAGRDVYQLVLAANRAAISAARVGQSFSSLQETAIRVLTEGMVELGILKGDVDTLLKEKAYRPYYMHNIGHWLGLDVHDAGIYQKDGKSRLLEPGMVLTIEPGLYLSATDDSLPEEFRGIGVRLEDDILVTESGPDILTREIPITIEEVEACMSGSS